ncbi:MAG TPA: CCA tRNA nucleotidyltransferase, partial [Lactobacillus sp.]|nr:CCA tRNA nucleotidyltransferase [Lactobacillus sp.]
FGLSSKQVNRLLKDWKSANQLIDDVQVAVKAVKAISEHSVDAWLLYQTGSELLPIANEVANQLSESPYATATLLAQYDELQIHSKKALAITGQDLMSAGIKPGPQLGQALNYLERQVVEGQLKNQNNMLLSAAIKYLNEKA